MESVYQELRDLAARNMGREKVDPLLEPTALVHEAFVRLAEGGQVDFKDRTHFLAVASSTIRRLLVDHARARRSLKRGGDFHRVTFNEALLPGGEPSYDILEIDRVLTHLSRVSPRQGHIVELRFFGGLKVEEVALHLEVSERTIRNEWRVARAWLLEELKAGE